jgi:hypothetical protein
MRRVGRILTLSLLLNLVLCATGITGCTLDGSSLSLNQCYNANTFFTTPLTLDWGSAFGPAVASSTNPFDVSQSAWTANIAGVNVSVSVGTDYVSNAGMGGTKFLTRADNEALVWDPNQQQWVDPLASHDPNLFRNFVYNGHFYAPGLDGNGNPQLGGGDHLLEMFTPSTQTYGTGSYVITFSQGITLAGLRLSMVGIDGLGFTSATANADFSATITAYGNGSTLVPLATYSIDTTGAGSRCASLNNIPPTACNDAPFIGIQSPGLSPQQIYTIVISANTGGLSASALLDSLQFQEFPTGVPEPYGVFLCGAGLLLIGVLRRKQRAGTAER